MIWKALEPGKLLLPEDTSRPPGLHVSHIIKDICQHLNPKVYGQPMDIPKVTMGLAFDEVLAKAIASGATGAFRPPPIKMDGIWLSPDGVDPNIWAVEEFKLTWYSAKKQFPTDEVYWPWLVQVKAYCRALETRLAKFLILYINGDYAPPKPWEPKPFGIEFTELEIEENWAMLVNHAKARGWL